MTDARTTDERTAISPPREPSANTGILAFAAAAYLPEIRRARG